MIKLTIADFYQQNYRGNAYCVYVVVHVPTKAVLYVGMSDINVWDRWFASIGQHVFLNYQGLPIPSMCSSIGKMVAKFPDDHIIELWTEKDLIKKFPQFADHKSERVPVHLLEEAMIVKRNPYYNVQSVSACKDTPAVRRRVRAYEKSIKRFVDEEERELKKAYDETFNKGR